MTESLLIMRIERRLKELDLTAAAASRLAGGSSDLIRNLKRGNNKSMSAANLSKLAKVLKCSPLYLTGQIKSLYPAETASEVPVVGYIGAGAEFHAIDDNAMGDGIDTIPAPPGCAPNAVAVQVRGESMSPVYMDGDVLIYWERRYDVDSFLNRRCVVGLSDGRILVKTLVRGAQSGLYTLMSFNSATIADVAVEWCAKIEWVQPR